MRLSPPQRRQSRQTKRPGQCRHQPFHRRIIVTGYPDLPEVRDAGRNGLTAAVIMKPWKKEEILRWAQHFRKVRDMRDALSAAREDGSQQHEH